MEQELDNRRVQVTEKSAYGQMRTYPVNRVAYAFCELLNSRTLTDLQIRQIQGLGFTVEFVVDVSTRVGVLEPAA